MPILNSKTYVITSPNLIQSAFRQKTLSFEPFVKEFADRMIGIGPEQMKIVAYSPENEKDPSFLQGFHKEIHENLLPGPRLQGLNVTMLSEIANMMNQIDNVFCPQSFYLWIRHTFTRATSRSLFGSQDPLQSDPSLIDSLWYVVRH